MAPLRDREVNNPDRGQRGYQDQEMSPMSHIIEEETGTYTRRQHRHNGYYAGDFSRNPIATPQQLAAIARMRPLTMPQATD